MPKFKVKGHVYLIPEAEIEVDAATPKQAMARAKQQFEAATYPSTLRRDCVVPNSTDDSHPEQFEPLEATPLPHQFA